MDAGSGSGNAWQFGLRHPHFPELHPLGLIPPPPFAIVPSTSLSRPSFGQECHSLASIRISPGTETSPRAVPGGSSRIQTLSHRSPRRPSKMMTREMPLPTRHCRWAFKTNSQKELTSRIPTMDWAISSTTTRMPSTTIPSAAEAAAARALQAQILDESVGISISSGRLRKSPMPLARNKFAMLFRTRRPHSLFRKCLLNLRLLSSL